MKNQRVPPTRARNRRRWDLYDGCRHQVFWKALFTGQIVSADWVAQMVRGRSEVGSERYGLGFWLHASTDTVMLEGSDAGVSFRTVHDPHADVTHTTISNTSDGAWPITKFLDTRLEI